MLVSNLFYLTLSFHNIFISLTATCSKSGGFLNIYFGSTGKTDHSGLLQMLIKVDL